MAKFLKTEKGHLTIELTPEDYKSDKPVGFQTKDNKVVVVCDTCLKDCSNENSILIPGIKRVLCKDCAEDFLSNIEHYKEDFAYEMKYFNAYAKAFAIPERARINDSDDIEVYIPNENQPSGN